LFNGNYKKVRKLDYLISRKLGFSNSYPITSQTYSRKIDSVIAKVLSGIGESASKFAVDVRLLSNLRVLNEPSESAQTGSSAMPYKQNPMRSERLTSLSRKLINLQSDFSHTAANQWLERSLDDSALRRMSIPQLFLLANAVLKLYQNIAEGLQLNPFIMKKHLDEELPFLAAEVILVEAVKRGADRQQVHEIIKLHSRDAANEVREGRKNDLFERLSADSGISLPKEFYSQVLVPERFAGAASVQTEEFCRTVQKELKKYPRGKNAEVRI
jgi:adenylosuccinate lyase